MGAAFLDAKTKKGLSVEELVRGLRYISGGSWVIDPFFSFWPPKGSEGRVSVLLLNHFDCSGVFRGVEGVHGKVSAIEDAFGDVFGKVDSIDRTDGLRVTFESSEVLDMRPSGNAPEFRCYNEADSEARVLEIQRISMEILLQPKG